MKSVFPSYIFSLTVFSPERQIQVICKSPGRDAIHLKLPPCPTPSLKSNFEINKTTVNATVAAVLKKTGSAVCGGFESLYSGACC